MVAATEATRLEGSPGDPRAGLIVAGTYRLGTHLGSGGMGDVYEAEHVRLGSRVAIKLLRANALADPRAVARFRREARALAALRSDHVVSVFDCGELDDGTPYLVMERLVGEDLRRLLAREGTLPVRRAVKLVIEACRGLGVVHAAGLVHRDLKPANLFVVQRSGEAEHVKILDFGVAKALTSEATHPGTLLGTVRYMAPEQLEDSTSATAAADIYALGAILYECLSGEPAHRGETVAEIMFDVLHRDPRPFAAAHGLPPELEKVVLKAVARDPSRRFASTSQLAGALAQFGPLIAAAPSGAERSDEATLVDVSSFAPPAGASGGRARGARWAAGGLVLGLGVGWTLRGSEPTANPPRAEQASPVSVARTAVAPAALTASPVPSSAAPAPASSEAAPEALPGARSASPEREPPPRPRSSPRRAAPTASARPVPARSEPLGGRFDSTNPYAE